MSYPFLLPSAESIRLEARLRPEMVNAKLASVPALDVYIGAKVVEKADMVRWRLGERAKPYLWPIPDDVQAAQLEGEVPQYIADILAGQLSIATQAVAKYTMSSIYFSAGLTTGGVQFKAEADDLMAQLFAAIDFINGVDSEGASTARQSPPRSTISYMIPRI